jgi:hypothetical protein
MTGKPRASFFDAVRARASQVHALMSDDAWLAVITIVTVLILLLS